MYVMRRGGGEGEGGGTRLAYKSSSNFFHEREAQW